ncbi:hypothetical protein CU097_008208 [Rhizopus azygosporus]|uniref:Uncharacterized protein n=1 Tax=Rhizopus azygosporus TaxID=86630 RepID=A0A367K998_RHIAZ|nr:hypothetical protein CU097_008208 [Rhizopus azygosporus]
MSNINYNTLNQSIQRHDSSYYQPILLPDPLERYGSAHLDQDIFGISVSRSTKDQQMVYPLFQWLKDSAYVWWIPLLPAAIVAAIMLWQLWTQYFQLSPRSRTVMLSIYSVSMSIAASHMISKLIYKEGILVVMMSTFGLFCLLFYTLQKKLPFSGAFPFVCSLGSICLSSLWFRHLYEMDPLEIIFPIAVSSLTCIYVILELYFIMKNVMSEDYILANIYLFVDFVYPIRFIHHFCELTDNMNVFPEILYPGDV